MLSHADYNEIFNNDIVDGMPVELLEIGELHVPTGQIVVCDPLVLPDMPPLNKTVKPGNYPVKIYIAKTALVEFYIVQCVFCGYFKNFIL